MKREAFCVIFLRKEDSANKLILSAFERFSRDLLLGNFQRRRPVAEVETTRHAISLEQEQKTAFSKRHVPPLVGPSRPSDRGGKSSGASELARLAPDALQNNRWISDDTLCYFYSFNQKNQRFMSPTAACCEVHFMALYIRSLTEHFQRSVNY